MIENRYKTALTPELHCTDIKQSLSFYTNVLGFNIQYQRPEDGFAMLERQGSRIMLDEISVTGTARTWISGPLEYPFGRGINFQISTTDIDTLYECVKSANAKIFLSMEEKWYRADDILLGKRQFIVHDPDGYLLRFSQDLGSKKAD